MKYDPEPDLLAQAIECPSDISNEPHSMLVLRVRSKPWIASAAAHVSVDGESYLQIADSIPHVVGVELLEDMDLEWETSSVLVRLLGPDVNLLRVLSDGDWRIGRQPMLLGREWCFVRETEAIGDGLYHVHGILRGRFESHRKAHPRGAKGFVSDVRHLEPVRDASVRPGYTIWLKTQPYSGKALPLTSCEAVQCSFGTPAVIRSEGKQP